MRPPPVTVVLPRGDPKGILSKGATPIPPGWTLTWLFANGQTVSQLWNGTVAQTGAKVTVQRDATIPVSTNAMTSCSGPVPIHTELGPSR